MVRRLGVILLAGLATLTLLGAVVVRLAPVVAQGPLINSLPGYTVYRVQILGVELYSDRALGRGDLATGSLLILLAAGLIGVALALRRAGSPAAGTLAVAAAGALFLAGDDLLSLHETVGLNLGFLGGVPGVDHPDDAIMGLYALAVALFLWWHRDLAPAGSRARWAWLVAAALGASAELLDLLPTDRLDRLEEWLEPLCALALVVAGVLTCRRLLERDTSQTSVDVLPV